MRPEIGSKLFLKLADFPTNNCQEFFVKQYDGLQFDSDLNTFLNNKQLQIINLNLKVGQIFILKMIEWKPLNKIALGH
jgi:hypothetical protein